jgi:hypothetical protein
MVAVALSVAAVLAPSTAQSDYAIAYDQNLVQDYGGACFGDSGGPSLLGDSDVIVSLVTAGDSAWRLLRD